MTPLQVMLLGHKMRQSQINLMQAINIGADGLAKMFIETDRLEREFDAAIEPYISHSRALAMEEGANVD